ncbi:calcium ATPase [Neocallimastix lanati (nom. inval.)]|jgi:Ca2+-transporting ATPase|uniref:Calcium ATPase n=1 Tax=Neocallimastix californiae TaxID=1754190 RepID=A0A1Y1Z8W5_9FUNG|nr:calcium ATPase [Neocallimastix sp. JGI-2020a]ORY06544.1 calcium ATPase [Neocallimastix californiae]|eukprot:ORY06544.1 calcium ATPase [Neocallimastix californiae]
MLNRVDTVGTFTDGKSSVEHQINIHVNDLTEVSNNNDISLKEVLAGLMYVMEYRIKGGRLPHLDYDLMKRLCNGLLSNIGHCEKEHFQNIPTEESDMALHLFGEFIQEVEEFRQVVREVPVTDLAYDLKIHRRCTSSASDEQKKSAVAVIGLLTKNFTEFADWKDLVKHDEHNMVEKVLKEYEHSLEIPEMPKSPEDLLPPQSLWIDRKVNVLLDMFKVDKDKGLSSNQIEGLRNHYGTNNLQPPPKPSIFKMIIEQVRNFMNIILIIATIVEICIGEYKDAAVLFVVIVINVVIGFTQEFKAEKALEALTSLTIPQALVIRDGTQEKINSSDLVPGDIVILDEGEGVPADLRIIEQSQLEIVESILTGESVPTAKDIKHIRSRTRKIPLADCKGNAFMGTVVAHGRGKGLVVRTGEFTEIGKISNSITSQPQAKTSIQRKLDILGKWLVVIAIVLCVIIVIINICYGNKIKETIEIGLSLAVSVIPEGLVAVVTVAMALGVRRMAKRNAIVRKLPSVETLGSVTVICSDKTGTLTEGKMGTSLIWTIDDCAYTFTESTNMDPNKGTVQKLATGEITEENLVTAVDTGKTYDTADAQLMAAILSASLCNNSSVLLDSETNQWKSIGDPTEVAMIVAAEKAGFSRSSWEKNGFTKLGEYPFDSERKLMSVIYTTTNNAPATGEIDMSANTTIDTVCPVPNTSIVLAKGAPEAILQRSISYVPSLNPGHGSLNELINGEQKPLTNEAKALIATRNEQMAGRGLRVLALAIRKVGHEEAQAIVKSENQQDSESNLSFIGLIGLIDPPKKGVRESITTCKNAGIRVIMITGDHVTTASAIARQLGIIDAENVNMQRTMKGSELDLLSDDAISELKPFPSVFARVSPDNKLKIVKALQTRHELAAMTGDGVNDAPAIKKADVGIAMGIGGTEITKQAADIVLADDNFSTIVEAIREGRRVYDNILKFIVYLLSCNSAEIQLMMICTIFNIPLPFTTIMILWANIIADVPPATALGLEPPEHDVMERYPNDPQSGILNIRTTIAAVLQGTIQAGVSFVLYMIAKETKILGDAETKHVCTQFQYAQTVAFAALITLQLIQAFHSRSVYTSVFKTGILENKWLVYANILSFVLMLIGIYVPGISDFLENYDIFWQAWLGIIIGLIVQLVIIELLKAYLRRYEHKVNLKKKQRFLENV